MDADRPRGILSPADREFLLGETEMNHEQSRRNAEARIRERVTNAVLDFYLLVHHLKEKDRRQIFEKSIDDDAFVEGLMAMVSFVYAGLDETGTDFEHVLVPAIRKSEEVYAADSMGTTVEVDVTFDVETTVGSELDDVVARLDAGDPVSPRELFSVVVEGSATPSDYDEIDLRLRGDDGALDEEGFVERLASFFDASVERVAERRVKLVSDRK